jgi:hypothetical protein
MFSADDVAAARAGRTWPMLFMKQALADLPIAEAFSCFVETLQLSPTCRLDYKSFAATRAAAEAGGSFFRELEPAGEGFVNVPARVLGDNDSRVIAGSKRSLYLACFDDVAVRGRSQLIERPERILLDYDGDERARIDDEVELDAAIFRGDRDGAWTISDASCEPLRVQECFSLLGPNSFAFGHWIADFLPRYWIARESGCLPDVPILIDQGMARQHRQILEMLVPAGTRIIEIEPMRRVEVDRLWFAPTFFYAPIYPRFNARFRYDFVAAPPDRFQKIFRQMLACLTAGGEADGGCDKIYLARKPGSRRKLINHRAIETVAVQAGFELLYLEDLDFPDQLRRIRQAKYLAGPEGSAFFMGFFARPRTHVLILNHPHTEYLTTVTALLDALDVDCTVLTGPFRRVDPDDYLHHSDYEIDPDRFSRVLEDWSGVR